MRFPTMFLCVLVLASSCSRSSTGLDEAEDSGLPTIVEQDAAGPGGLADSVPGRYYHGDGLGVNLSLTLDEDGTFECGWRGCLGDYGRTSGTWALEGTLVRMTTLVATGMFEDSPLEDFDVLETEGGVFLLPDSRREFYDEFGAGRYSGFTRSE